MYNIKCNFDRWTRWILKIDILSIAICVIMFKKKEDVVINCAFAPEPGRGFSLKKHLSLHRFYRLRCAFAALTTLHKPKRHDFNACRAKKHDSGLGRWFVCSEFWWRFDSSVGWVAQVWKKTLVWVVAIHICRFKYRVFIYIMYIYMGQHP